jgi:hypothetical protein
MRATRIAWFSLFLLWATPCRADVHFSPPDIQINSSPPGTSYNGGLFTCDNNGVLYAMYNSSRNAVDPTQEVNALEVYFNTSTDHGATWATDWRIDSGPGVLGIPDRLRIWSPFIGCDDAGRFYGGWMDGRDFNNPLRPNPGSGWWEDGLCNRTVDSGLSWLHSDVRVNGWNGNYPRCAMPVSANDGNGNVYVAWYSTKDQPTNYNEIFVNHSPDFGATWPNDTRIDSASPSASEWSPQIKCDQSGHVYAAWESSARRQIRFNYSHDYGSTWQPADIRVDTDNASGKSRGSAALACDENGHVYAAWKDYRDAIGGLQSSIYFNRSADQGVTWGVSDIRLDSMGSPPHEGPEYGPQIACTNDGTVYALWEDKRSGGEWDLFFNRSTDYGATWAAGNVRLDTDALGGYRSFRPQLAVDGDNGVYAVWEDWREGYHHIYMNYSMDRGATWQASDMRVDTDPAAAHAEWPRLCVDAHGVVYVAWGYRRTTWTGDCDDIHFNYYDPGQASGLPPTGTRTRDGLMDVGPNPFTVSSTIWYRISTPETVSLEIFDVAGHRLRLMDLGRRRVGIQSVFWDGAESNGTPVAPGVYYIRLMAGGQSWTRALTRIQ